MGMSVKSWQRWFTEGERREIALGKWLRSFLMAVMVSSMVSGCASKTGSFFVKEGADLTFIKKVAVMPFENNTKENNAPSRVRNIVVTQILVDNLFDVTETGQLEKILDEEGGKSESKLDEVAIKRIGKRLSAQAFLFGSVDDYDVERLSSYSYPKVALTLRLVDAETGIILWQASGAKDGYSGWARLWGTRGQDQSEVTFVLVRSLLMSLR